MHQRNLQSLTTQDNIAFGCVLDAPWQVTEFGRSADLQPGDGVLLSNADLGALSFPRACRCVAFGMPRAELAPLVPDLGGLFARRIPAASPSLQMLLRYLELGRDRQIAADPDLQAAFAQHVKVLLALTLAAIRDAAGESLGSAAVRLRKIQDDIRRSCREPELTIHAVAARQGVSARYAQRIFEASGTTFTDYLNEQRLQAVHQALRHSPTARVCVSSIAYDCGFSDISHFNRLFRRRFDCTPTDVRKAVVRAG
jgi:AraC-like DNA-binding protein